MLQQVEGMTMAQESIQHVAKTTPDVVGDRITRLSVLSRIAMPGSAGEPDIRELTSDLRGVSLHAQRQSEIIQISGQFGRNRALSHSASGRCPLVSPDAM
jgi:hypothetical protein